MELYFASTGNKSVRDLFVTQMQCQPFVLNGVGPNGKKLTQTFMGMLEPIELYRYVFPKEGLGMVLNTLTSQKTSIPSGLKAPIWAMRKGLGLKEIPEPIHSIGMNVNTENMWIVPIGIKEDKEEVTIENGQTHEKI